MGGYFGTDGVRGEANRESTPELAFKLGRYGDYVLGRHEEEGKRPRVLVGRDTRISGQMLEGVLILRPLSMGIEMFQLGVISTPGATCLIRLQKTSVGAMISASYSPTQDSGVKFFGADGSKLVDDQELEIEVLLDAKVNELPRSSAEGLGTVEGFPEDLLKHSQFLVQTISGSLSGLTICVDAANGVTSTSVNRLFADLETDFCTMGTNPDRSNINDGVGSTHSERLAEVAVEKGADAGLAFDGDGDRIIAVGELGDIIDSDKIMFIYVKYLAEKN